jgi:hypothetical protein
MKSGGEPGQTCWIMRALSLVKEPNLVSMLVNKHSNLHHIYYLIIYL